MILFFILKSIIIDFYIYDPFIKKEIHCCSIKDLNTTIEILCYSCLLNYYNSFNLKFV